MYVYIIYMYIYIYVCLCVYVCIWAIPPKLAPVPENTVFALFDNIIEQIEL